MKQNKFTKLMYLLCIFLFMFGVLYLMWTGANYLFIDGNHTRANTLDIVMIVVLSWYTTRDVYYDFCAPKRMKHGNNKNLTKYQWEETK